MKGLRLACLVPWLVLGMVAGGCAARRAVWQDGKNLPAAVTSESAGSRAAQALAQAEEAWKDRTQLRSLEQAIAHWQQAASLAPTPDIYVRLARAHHFRGEWFYSFDPAERRRLLDSYKDGIQAAELAVGLSSPAFVKRVRAGGSWEQALDVLGPESAPGLYWYAVNLARWAQAEGFQTMYTQQDGCQFSPHAGHPSRCPPRFPGRHGSTPL